MFGSVPPFPVWPGIGLPISAKLGQNHGESGTRLGGGTPTIVGVTEPSEHPAPPDSGSGANTQHGTPEPPAESSADPPAPGEQVGATAVRQPPAPSRRAVIAGGQPYHLLARNSAHRWWRPLAALVVFVVVAVLALVTSLVTLVALATLPRLGSSDVFTAADQVLRDEMFLLFAGFATLTVLLPSVWVAVRTVQNRPFSSVSSVVGRLRWRWLGECLGIAAALLGAVFAFGIGYELIAGPREPVAFPGWPTYLTIAAIALLVVPVQCAAEEYAFRGFLVQTLTAWTRTPWVGIVLSAVAFLFSHGYTDWLVWLQLLLMALVMSWLTLRTGGLEAAIGLHVANNVLSLLVAGVYGVPSLEQAGDFAAADVVPFLVVIPLYGWFVDRRARQHGLHNVLGGRERISPWTLQVVRSG